MIVKMKFLSITGPKDDISRVTESYLSKYDIQLENVLSELKTDQDLRPYVEVNPYKENLNKASEFMSMVDTKKQPGTMQDLSLEEALLIIDTVDADVAVLRKQIIHLEEKKKIYLSLVDKIEPYRELNYKLDSILHFKFIKFRFGKISTDNYKKLEKYVLENLNTIFYKCHSDEIYVWGVYFAPAAEEDTVDEMFESMKFERLWLPDEYNGTPEQAYRKLEKDINETNAEIAKVNTRINTIFNLSKWDLISAYEKIKSLSTNFDVRNLAACTQMNEVSFYVLCGWIAEKDAQRLMDEVENDESIFCTLEEDPSTYFSTPPTELKNPKVFKPFELFTRMYGLPAYDEFDPTIFVALTYIFIFGCMFGDLGQGFLLFIGGALLYKFKKIDLAAIISLAGICSMIFGLMYGSIFGFEDVIPALWLHPMEQMITLPGIGTLNAVLILSVAFGMGVILLTMIFNIINGIRQKNIEKILFDHNGVAGLIFYGSIVVSIALMINGNLVPGGIVLAVMLGVPLILIGLKEPLTALIEKKSKVLPDDKAIFFVQAFFELFEVVLSYITNTISFVRIGAFALSHVGMMEVVLLLAGAENGGSPNWLLIILGNLIVMGMEGLIVGIHVLRLEYYEMFSRYFSGSGREFRPYTKEKQ